MKNGNLYQEVKSAKKDSRVAYAKRDKVSLAMEKEIGEATRLIREKYEPVLEALEKEVFEKDMKAWHIAGTYHDYGTFYTRDITDIVAIFLTYIEGEKYIPYRNWDNHEISENSIIIKDAVNSQYDKFDYDTLDMLYENGDLIILDQGFSNMVDFYDYYGDPNYSFGTFNYLCEFVNRLIQYRIDNGLKNVSDITMENLYSFMCSFISTHPDLAQMNRDKREQMLMNQNEKETLITECRKLERKFKKNKMSEEK